MFAPGNFVLSVLQFTYSILRDPHASPFARHTTNRSLHGHYQVTDVSCYDCPRWPTEELKPIYNEFTETLAVYKNESWSSTSLIGHGLPIILPRNIWRLCNLSVDSVDDEIPYSTVCIRLQTCNCFFSICVVDREILMFFYYKINECFRIIYYLNFNVCNANETLLIKLCINGYGTITLIIQSYARLTRIL